MSHNSSETAARELLTRSMSFSVLMSIYDATQADELDLCLKSLTMQELPTDQVVIVRDGPVNPNVEKCIANFSSSLPFEHLHFPSNRGLGYALRDGLEICSNELVARVDCDDYSLPERFALQYNYLQKNPAISVVGGWMKEHYLIDGASSTKVRQTPLNPLKVAHAAWRRNPVNHPTAMFRKSHVLESGGYQPCLLFEDYFLWARMLMAGYQIANLPQVLVETNVGPEYFARRGGIRYLHHELHLLKKLRSIGFLSGVNSVVFLLSRLPMRLAPLKLREQLYGALLRKN